MKDNKKVGFRPTRRRVLSGLAAGAGALAAPSLILGGIRPA
jgi:hypothetical protein